MLGLLDFRSRYGDLSQKVDSEVDAFCSAVASWWRIIEVEFSLVLHIVIPAR